MNVVAVKASVFTRISILFTCICLSRFCEKATLADTMITVRVKIIFLMAVVSYRMQLVKELHKTIGYWLFPHDIISSFLLPASMLRTIHLYDLRGKLTNHVHQRFLRLHHCMDIFISKR